MSQSSRVFEIIEQAYQPRREYVERNQLEAFRLYDSEDSWLPVAIDLYQKNAVIHIFEKIDTHQIREIEASLKQIFGIQDFYYKNRTKKDIKLIEKPQKTLTVKEYGHTFFLNLSDYLDTGLFLDHRETRRWVESESKNKIVLNTFAYTGSFSIYAAAGGATKTYSVDLSRTYCDWIKKNLELNSLPPEKNWVYKMDTFEFFRYAKRKNMQFDIIIIDPPTFSRNKGQSFSVEEQYPNLINQALELLTPTGYIIFSNNKHGFRLESEKLSPCKIQDIQQKTMPPDFTDTQTHECFVISKK